MDFDQAIDAHVRWKVRLRTFMGGKGEKLESATVARDSACDLGKWIYSEAGRNRSNPAFEALRKEHANFHRCAAAVVKSVEDGRKDAAASMIEAGSAFADASMKTVNAIRTLRQNAATV